MNEEFKFLPESLKLTDKLDMAESSSSKYLGDDLLEIWCPIRSDMLFVIAEHRNHFLKYKNTAYISNFANEYISVFMLQHKS